MADTGYTVYTGVTVHDDAPALDLLADVAVACVGGHTRVVFVRRVAEAIALHAPLRRLEVAWLSDGADESVEVASARGVWRVTHEGAPRSRASISDAIEARRPVEHVERGRGRVTTSFALPLFEDGVAVGGVVLALAASDGGSLESARAGLAGTTNDTSSRGASERSPRTHADECCGRAALLRALGAVLLAGHRACRTIERVAAASLRAHQDNAALRRRLDALAPGDVVARSPAMRDALVRADLAAEHEVTVLLRGESGTGKGVLARRIHARSTRAQGPFVHVDCAALPESLVESELFGHEVGAFTGATRRHVGKVERAAGGTLFLDEVGELLPAAQAKLLRLLQDGTFERVGGERELRARARILAATHRPLEQMIADGLWRADLYHRIAVFPIWLPPVRERPEDIPELVEAALSRAAARLSGRRTPVATDDAVACLVRHPWPGNVRELENLIERAAILARGGPIDRAVLVEAGLPVKAASSPRPATARVADDGGPVSTLEAATRQAVARALHAAEGRIYGPRGAAAMLGLKPSTLQTKMIALGLRRADFVSGG